MLGSHRFLMIGLSVEMASFVAWYTSSKAVLGRMWSNTPGFDACRYGQANVHTHHPTLLFNDNANAMPEA